MSTIRTDTLQNAAGTKSVPVATVVDGSAKAWVNFNGTGTVAIRASFNVSSIADRGVGKYTVNFITSLTDANYAAVATINKFDATDDANASVQTGTSTALQTAGAVNITCGIPSSVQDSVQVSVAIFR